MCDFKNILFQQYCLALPTLPCDTKRLQKCKINLQNVIKISFLHIEKHNYIEVETESCSEKGVLKTSERHTFLVTLRTVELQL